MVGRVELNDGLRTHARTYPSALDTDRPAESPAQPRWSRTARASIALVLGTTGPREESAAKEGPARRISHG